MKKHRLYIIIYIYVLLLVLGLSGRGVAQNHANRAYTFMNATHSARTAALGGKLIANADNDISTILYNPAAINTQTHHTLALSFVDLGTGIKSENVSYGQNWENLGNFAATIQFVNYGSFDGYDQDGISTGTFHANDLALVLGWGRQLDSSFSIGANFKPIYSQLEHYSSFGIAVDVSTIYKDESKRLVLAAALCNVGTMLTTYTSNTRDYLPFDLQLSMSKSLSHLPLRYYITLHHLYKWNLRYDQDTDPDIETDAFTGKRKTDSQFIQGLDNALRHVIIGGELTFGKRFSLRASYNHYQAKELRSSYKGGMVGFAWGAALYLAKFDINYSRSVLHLAKTLNFITISTNLNSFGKK